MTDEQEDTQEQPESGQPEQEMQTYIGCKVIQARPMDEDQFRKRQNRPTVVESENAPGYMVRYPDGYTSWSPKQVFEEAYRLVNDKEQAMCR